MHTGTLRGGFDYTREGGVVVKARGGTAHLEGEGKGLNPGNTTGHWQLRRRQGSRFLEPPAGPDPRTRRPQPCETGFGLLTCMK